MKKYYYHQTCYACPEQYDVYESKGDVDIKERIAYVRLRFGCLCCDVPFGGETVFSEIFENDGMKGSFDSEEERTTYLSLIDDAIFQYLNNTNNGNKTTT